MSTFDKVMYWIGLITTIYATGVALILLSGVVVEEVRHRKKMKKLGFK